MVGHINLAAARFPENTIGSKLDILARLALWDFGLDYKHGTGEVMQIVGRRMICQLK